MESVLSILLGVVMFVGLVSMLLFLRFSYVLITASRTIRFADTIKDALTAR